MTRQKNRLKNLIYEKDTVKWVCNIKKCLWCKFSGEKLWRNGGAKPTADFAPVLWGYLGCAQISYHRLQSSHWPDVFY